jgi:hypothetical protein
VRYWETAMPDRNLRLNAAVNYINREVYSLLKRIRDRPQNRVL